VASPLGPLSLCVQTQQVLQQLREGQALTDDMLARLAAQQLPRRGVWEGVRPRERMLRNSVRVALDIVQRPGQSGAGLGAEATSCLVNCLRKALRLSNRRAASIVRAEVAATGRAILADACVGTRSGRYSVECLGTAKRRLAAVCAAFPLDPESAEAIEVAAAVRRVDTWLAENS
jgi:hypothetical protein